MKEFESPNLPEPEDNTVKECGRNTEPPPTCPECGAFIEEGNDCYECGWINED
jgi:hypothetical protein